MADRKIAFFDIDGTIWDYKNFIPESTIRAIRTLRKNGNYAFLCSGRGRCYIRDPALFEIGFDGVVSGCGTMIELNDEVVFYSRMENELTANTLKTVRGFGMLPILEGREFLYMEYDDFKDQLYGQKLINEMGKRIKGIDECWGEWECSKLSCDTDGCNIDECYKVLQDDFDFIVHTDAVVEMVPKGLSKATGMRRVAELLDIPMEDTIAFGDGENDIEMMEEAGLGIAMGNGNDHVRQVADYVTDSLYDDGIYKACVHFGLI